MPSFLQTQANFGRPAEAPYIPRDIELEGTNLALQDILPQQTRSVIGDLGAMGGEFLDVDKDHYLDVKQQIATKAEDLKNRLDKGERISSLVPEINKFRENAANMMNEFKQRKNIYENWYKTQILNNKDLDSNTKTRLTNLAKNNLRSYTNKAGITSENLPLPQPAKPVNIELKSAEIVDKLVEIEGRESYGSKWEELKADPTKYANFKYGITHRDPEKIKNAVIQGLAGDHEVQSSLDQDAELQLHEEYMNLPDEYRAEAKEMIPQAHQKMKSDRINQAADLLGWTKEGLKTTQDRSIIDNTEASERAKLAAGESLPTHLMSQFNTVKSEAFDKFTNLFGEDLEDIKSYETNKITKYKVTKDDGTVEYLDSDPRATGLSKAGLPIKNVESVQINSQNDPKYLEQQKFIIKLKNTQPDLFKGKSNEQALKAYHTAVKNWKEQSTKEIVPTTTQMKGLQDKLLNDASRRGAWLADDPNAVGTLKDVLDKLEVEDPEFEKHIKEASININPYGPVPGVYSINYTDPDGKSRPIYVEPDIEQQQAFRTSHTLAKAVNSSIDSGTPVPVRVPAVGFTSGIVYEVSSKIKNGKLQPIINIYESDSNGNKTGPILEETTLEQQQDSDEKNWMKSGYGGSRMNLITKTTP